jgi:hypothetical protein
VKAIFDTSDSQKPFPLSKLLSTIREDACLAPTTAVTLLKLGGLGAGVWAHESRLDDGFPVEIPFHDLELLAAGSDAYIDELFATVGPIFFGISDTTFMFIRNPDKKAEMKSASRFARVREIPDISPPDVP